MADAILKEDDYLSTSIDAVGIVYHPNLNVILVFSKNGEVRVIDINSGGILHSCNLQGKSNLKKIYIFFFSFSNRANYYIFILVFILMF